jgi:ABC-type branched-subunit amino acid transport system substrate-binding protein
MTSPLLARRALLGTALAAPFIRPSFAQGGDPYVIGTLFPMSGPNAEYGKLFTDGVQLAIEHMRADNMLRRPVRLQSEDSQALPQQAVIGMTKLINVDRASWVLVGFTAVSKAVAPIADRAKVVTINGGAVGPDLERLSPYFWNVIPLAHLETRAIFPFLIRRNLKRVALIYVDDPFGDAILQLMQREFPAAGGTVAGVFSIPRAQQNFGAVAARVRQARPDAVYIASFGAQQPQIIKGLRDNGVTQPLVSYSGINIGSVLSLPEAEGLIFTSQKFDFSGGDEVTRRFAADFKARHGTDPAIYNTNYYNGTRLFALLARELERENRPVNGDTLRETLLRLREFDLVGGKASFDEHGSMTAAIQINEIRGGRMTPIAG